MRALLYTRHGATRWVRYLAKNAPWLSETLVVSELRGEGDYSLADRFYSALSNGDAARARAEREFGTIESAEIIARCRVLRALPKTKALAMIGAITEACEDVLDRFAPEMFLATRVDSYVLDVMDRLLTKRGIPYVGWWRAAVVPKMIFFTRRGEHTPIRAPAESEVAEFVTRVSHEEFKATSLRTGARFDKQAFFRRRLYYFLRDRYLALQSHLQRDPLGYRFLASSLVVPEYSVRFSDWKLVRRLNSDWQGLFQETPFEKRLFVGLQVNPESTIDYYVPDVRLLHCKAVLLELVKAFGARGYRIFIKDHPNMFGMRRTDFFDDLLSTGAVISIPYDVPSPPLVNQSMITFTWSGTVGLQSAMNGQRPIVAQPPYFVPGPFVQLNSFDEIQSLPSRVEQHRNPMSLSETRVTIARHVLSACIPGSLSYAGFEENDPARRTEADRLIKSVGTYLPRILEQLP